jgi:hypothetical protein
MTVETNVSSFKSPADKALYISPTVIKVHCYCTHTHSVQLAVFKPLIWAYNRRKCISYICGFVLEVAAVETDQCEYTISLFARHLHVMHCTVLGPC